MAVSGPLVLVGFGEAYAAIETAWSLRDAGFRVAAYTRSGEHPAVRRVRGVALHEVAPPEAGVERTLEDLRSHVARCSVSRRGSGTVARSLGFRLRRLRRLLAE